MKKLAIALFCILAVGTFAQAETPDTLTAKVENAVTTLKALGTAVVCAEINFKKETGGPQETLNEMLGQIEKQMGSGSLEISNLGMSPNGNIGTTTCVTITIKSENY